MQLDYIKGKNKIKNLNISTTITNSKYCNVIFVYNENITTKSLNTQTI